MTPSVRSFLQMSFLGFPFVYFQMRLYYKSSMDAMLNALEAAQTLFNFTLPTTAETAIKFWFFCANTPCLIALFFPSTLFSYQEDVEKYYWGGPSSSLQRWMESRVYKRASFFGSIYKSLIQVFSLYDFIQQIAEWVQASLLDWMYGENFSENETASKSILGISSVIGFVVAVIALFGVLLATYGFFSKRDPHPDEDGPLKFCGQTIGKKTVMGAVLLYTLTNVVLYVKNIFPLFKALRETDYPYLLPTISGTLITPFLVAYTGVTGAVYYEKAKRKLLAPLDQVGQELRNFSMFENRNSARKSEELQLLEQPSLETVQPSKLVSCGATLKEFFIFLFLSPLFAVMASGFKSTAQGLQTVDDSFFGPPFDWGLGLWAGIVTFLYYYAFCCQAKPQSQSTINRVSEVAELNQSYFQL